mmetsp:Transcript_1253/g.1887  ORF Transcript_1253/g.1887 Transcript_1253/m.1887 type:complete len:296 (+) Transcript_1253:152-1039(+)
MKSPAKLYTRSVAERDAPRNHEKTAAEKISNHVTCFVTFHPEKADETIYPKLHASDANPWSTVYEEVKGDIPYATAVPCDDEVSSLAVHDQKDDQKVETKASPFYMCCSPIGMLVGCVMSAAAILNVLICELISFLFYGMAAFAYRTAKSFQEDGDQTIDNGWSMIAHSFLLIFYYSFAMVDALILVVISVFTTEILAAITWIVTILFFVGDVDKADQWHQYIRRTCHHIRWAFRSPCQDPARSHFCSTKNQSDKNEEDELETVEDQLVISDTSTSAPRAIDDIYEVGLEDVVVK